MNAGRGLCAASWTRAAGMACRALPTCLGAAGGRRGLSRRKGSEMADPQIQTEEYIEEHGLRQLFQARAPAPSSCASSSATRAF